MKEDSVYFVGIGGIGMANLARYYMHRGARVAGYDRTPSELTAALEKEGADITYTDDTAFIPTDMRDPAATMVVYTPAVPADNNILSFFRDGGFDVMKRAALLGKITRHSKGICVAGSHGKTTTCSMTAHILYRGKPGCNAFLGGISRNYDSNLLLTPGSEFSVIEADEYDRSFHQLSPHIAVVTSTDPDHLDIYGDEAGYLEGFAHFTSLITPGGFLLLHTGLKLKPRTRRDVKIYTYAANDLTADCHAENVRHTPGRLFFDFVGPEGLRIEGIELGVPVDINIDNAVAAIAAALLAGATPQECAEGISTFLGAKRRFEIWLRPEDYPSGRGTVLIDDYAHSPAEVKASIRSVKALYPGHEVTVVFQPHLYTRTRDFAPEFAEALGEADEAILCEIYPARELPLPGITSEVIVKDIKSAKKSLIERKNLLDLVKNRNFDILMTLGAADINVLLPEIKHILLSKTH